MRTEINKKTGEISLIMNRDEAAYLHAYLGESSSENKNNTVQQAIDGMHGTFLPSDFDVENFSKKQLEDNCSNNYYFSLDSALEKFQS